MGRFKGRSGRQLRRRAAKRAGVSTVEFAVVASLFLFLLFGIVVLGLGVFRYNQIAGLAHEAARWGAVHGREFERLNEPTLISKEDFFQQAVRPRAAALDLRKLECDVSWDENKSTVTVTVRYQWVPEVFFAPVTLSSTSHMLVSY